MREYNICYSLDSNYLEQLLVSAASILSNTDNSCNINIYILDGGLTEEDKNSIEKLKNIGNFNVNYISVNEADFRSCPLLKDKGEEGSAYHVTLPTYFRFKAAEYMPDISTILYLDCDVIVRSSLEELFETEMHNTPAAMIKDAESDKEAARLGIKNYYNAGVMLINLDYWRENNISGKLFDYAENNKETVLWQDQDVINAVLSEEIKPLDKKWNFQYFLYNSIELNDLESSAILHLSGRFKPWLIPFEHPVYDIYYRYLALTDKRNRIVTYKQSSFGKFLKNNIGGDETNIRISVSDEDIQKVYDEIAKNYEQININSIQTARETDIKLQKVYEEIKDNYDFAETRLNQLDEKTARETDIKLQNIFDEIADNYEFTKKAIFDSKYEITCETDDKFTPVYEEITKNYKYTEALVDKAKDEIRTSVDEKLANLFDKIAVEKAEIQTDVERAVSYIDFLVKSEEAKQDSFRHELENKINNSAAAQNRELNDKFNVICGNMSNFEKKYETEKGYIYTDISDRIYEAKQDITEKFNNITDNLYVSVEEKINAVEKNANMLIEDKTAALQSKSEHQYQELYTHINGSISDLYKQLKESNSYIENIFSNKVNNVYRLSEELKSQVNFASEALKDKAAQKDLAVLAGEFKQLTVRCEDMLAEAQAKYDEDLNAQRILYETQIKHLNEKLQVLEADLFEHKKSLFTKLTEKYRKSKRV